MKLVFCGTPDFAVPTLESVLAAGHEVALVLTQPDRPAGRKLAVQAPAVKLAAQAHNLQVLQPDRIKRNEELRTRLEAIKPEAILVVAYGRLIPDWMLALPRYGNLNLHGSLLPKYRGAAPIQWAVANGDTETGVSTMHLDAGLDTGDVLLTRPMPIGADTTAAELYPVLAKVGAALMVETLQGLEDGTLVRKPQQHAAATLAPVLTREDGDMRPTERSAPEIYNRFRGFYPWPGAWSTWRGKRFLVHAMRPVSAEIQVAAGALALSGDRLLLGAADGGVVELVEVQTEGKPRMAGAAFAHGFQLRSGEHLG